MLMAWPVTNAASGDASQSAAAATSSGRPQRASGVDSATERWKSRSTSRANLVSIQPGQSTLTRTRGARRRARLLLKASTPPLTALNSSGFSPAIPAVTWSQLMFTMVPPLGCSRMTAPAAYEQATVPLRSIASRRSSLRSQPHSAALPVSTSAPALLTHTSRSPSRSRASATSASQVARALRSTCATCALPPTRAIRSATADAASALSRWVTSTAAPALPNASAMAAPMPLLAPVTTARTPSSRRPPVCATWVMSRPDYTMPQMPVKQSPRRSPASTGGVARPGPDDVVRAAQLACVLEASAEKPGNVTPSHDFDDTSYEDMLRSGIALGPELGHAGERGVGETALAAVRASRGAAGANTNLGIALLLAPLARAALSDGPLRERLGDVLRALTVDDARCAYAAIRLAGAGGLDEPVAHDVRDEPRVTLREAMAAAAQRDTIASEYVTDHSVTFELGLPALVDALDDGLRPRNAVVELALRLLAAVPDTLIARKRGAEAAGRAAASAQQVLTAGGVRSARGRSALAGFDSSLRREGNALNPGTTADLVTAVLFVALLEGVL